MKKCRKKSKPVSLMTPKLALLKLLKNDKACRTALWDVRAQRDPVDVTEFGDACQRFIQGDTIRYTFHVVFSIPDSAKIQI